jgi:glycosyltransferase involved in cell wall biosynthesis
MRLTALVESIDHVCCRYRLAAYRRALAGAGYELEFLTMPRRPWHWLGLGRRLRGSDIVVVQRKLLQAWQLLILRRAARLLIYDFDDAVFLRDSYAPKGLHSTTRLLRFAAMVRAADRVMAGNDFLCEQAGCWTDPHRVVIIPTCIDHSLYPAARHEAIGTAVELVWIGSASTLQGLDRARPLLEAAGARLPGMRFKLIAGEFMHFEHFKVLACAWSRETEAIELAAADIGVSWLPDDLWSRGKCGLKVLQYMCAGLPVVANPVGVQAEMVKHGENGFLAETPEEWADAIETLARDPALRRRMGSAGRQLARERYDVSIGAECWLRLLAGQTRWRQTA